ncbi:MAG: hypothetical protein R6U63_10255 [Longimicrobiales bacterium]
MKETKPMPKAAATLPGFIIGLLWLAMALATLWSAAQGYANNRSDWGLGWGLVAFFLLAAALSALVGTWWHNFRVTKDSH